MVARALRGWFTRRLGKGAPADRHGASASVAGRTCSDAAGTGTAPAALDRKFAALNYVGTTNLGDEIQSIAAMRFLPRVDAFVDRERLDAFDSPDTHRIILNGWFLHRPEHWPPSPKLDPLLISFHLTRDMHAGFNALMIPPSSTVLSATGLDYLRQRAPIGARDLDTLRQLQEHRIDSYFSGCLTLTLQAPADVERTDEIYGVDIDEDVRAFFEARCGRPVVPVSHLDYVDDTEERFRLAQSLLRRYAGARAVITSRLHCALPCLALGTPVLLVENAADAYRFDGLRDLCHRASRGEILAGACRFDPAAPPGNGTAWHALRDSLTRSCSGFAAC